MKLITEERYRNYMAKAYAQMGVEVRPEFVDKQVERLRRNGQLVTEQQLQDSRKDRKLRVGDRARYVWEDRNEQTKEGSSVRPHGQVGQVVEVKNGLVRFRPDAPAVATRVTEMLVREGTIGYYALERLP